MPQDHADTGSDAVFSDRIGRILPRVGGADFERAEPPADLWARIEASIAADRDTVTRVLERPPKEPPTRGAGVGTVVEYSIDAADRVVDTGRSWADFASANAAPELASLAPDCTLWTYMDGDEIRELWQLLVERVRATQKTAQVPLRCDAPDARRWFDMTLTPESDGAVHFRCVLAFEESRPPVALLDPLSEREQGAEPVPVCSWCGRGQHGSEWLDIEELIIAARLLEQVSLPPISEGICATCREEMSAELLVPGAAGESTT